MASDQGQMVFLVYRRTLVPHIAMRIWFFRLRASVEWVVSAVGNPAL